MTHDELLAALSVSVGIGVDMGAGSLEPDALGIVAGEGRLRPGPGQAIGILCMTGGRMLSPEIALALAARVLDHIERFAGTPLLLLIDAGSQSLSRRDELLGLNEYLAHLTQAMHLASVNACRTVAILYGKAAAGAMIATAMAADYLVAVPGAAPSVMDLPSIARVTKLSPDALEAMSRLTPIFAPGVRPLFDTGAFAEHWTEPATFAARLRSLLGDEPDERPKDRRDQTGASRGGRTKAAAIAQRVISEALGDG